MASEGSDSTRLRAKKVLEPTRQLHLLLASLNGLLDCKVDVMDMKATHLIFNWDA